MSYSNHVTLVMGHRGSGKTTWLYHHLEDFVPLVLIDPLADPKFLSLGYYNLDSMPEAFKFFKSGNPQRVYVSPNNIEAFDLFVALVLARGKITMVIDEVDNYAKSQYVSPYFKQALKYGRHREVNIVMVARRFKEINMLLRSQATRFIIFPSGYEDIKELTPHIGIEASEKLQHLTTVDRQYTQYLDFDFHSNTSEIKTLNYVNIS